MMEWTDALRKYAQMKGVKWHIPKKGTEAYNEVKKIQASGKGALTKAQVKKAVAKMEKKDKKAAPRKVEMDEEGGMKITIKGKRKERSDKGSKRMTGLQVAKETARLGILSKAEALGRKVRSDKGKKRGPRKAKVSTSEVVKFDEEGNIM